MRERHAHAVALHFMYYNFGRIHKTLRVTPAMKRIMFGLPEEIAALAKKRYLRSDPWPAVSPP